MKKVLKNAHIIPMTEKTILSKQDLLIENGTITGIGPNLGTCGAETIDCTDRYVIPGLFDMHVHLDEPEMPGLLFANGITSVRNMWGRPYILEWKKAVAQGGMIGPRINSANPLTDGLKTWEGCGVISTEAEAEAAVLRAIEEGYDYFKAYPDIKREVFIALMESASKYGMKVVGHGNNNVTAAEMIQLGYYSLEHISRLPEQDADIITLAQGGMWFTPTHFVLMKVDEYVCQGKDPSSCAHAEYVSAKCQAEWEKVTKIRRDSPRFAKFNLTDFVRRAKTFLAHSDRILLGTDTINPGVVPGFSLHEELRQMVVVYGLEPYEAIKMGTVNAAASLGITKNFGTIEVGKAADLLLLEDNPLTAIENTTKIFGVMQGGRFYTNTKLKKILEECRSSKEESAKELKV